VAHHFIQLRGRNGSHSPPDSEGPAEVMRPTVLGPLAPAILADLDAGTAPDSADHLGDGVLPHPGLIEHWPGPMAVRGLLQELRELRSHRGQGISFVLLPSLRNPEHGTSATEVRHDLPVFIPRQREGLSQPQAAPPQAAKQVGPRSGRLRDSGLYVVEVIPEVLLSADSEDEPCSVAQQLRRGDLADPRREHSRPLHAVADPPPTALTPVLGIRASWRRRSTQVTQIIVGSQQGLTDFL